jgi:uncharacterized protein with HEPN domain
MPRRGDSPALKDIVEAVDRIQRYLGDISLAEFLANTEKQDAVVRNLEIIGEAVKHLSPELREQHTKIEWTKIAAMRDRLVHHYFGVNWMILWDVVQERLSPLKAAVQEILGDIEG